MGSIQSSASEVSALARSSGFSGDSSFHASGALLFYNCYISLNKTPSLTVNELMACEVTLSMLAEPVRYSS